MSTGDSQNLGKCMRTQLCFSRLLNSPEYDDVYITVHNIVYTVIEIQTFQSNVNSLAFTCLLFVVTMH